MSWLVVLIISLEMNPMLSLEEGFQPESANFPLEDSEYRFYIYTSELISMC